MPDGFSDKQSQPCDGLRAGWRHDHPILASVITDPSVVPLRGLMGLVILYAIRPVVPRPRLL